MTMTMKFQNLNMPRPYVVPLAIEAHSQNLEKKSLHRTYSEVRGGLVFWRAIFQEASVSETMYIVQTVLIT